MQEKIVETKICEHCSLNFEISDKDLEFYDKISPVFAGKKYSIPSPILCPDCRQQRRIAFRNERKLYRRKEDMTGEDIISIYSPLSPYKVYSNENWWGDNWDPMNFSREMNFGESFFNQLKKLQIDVPRIVSNLADVENVMYSNQCWHAKDFYLCFNVGYSQNCFYTNETYHSKNIIDCLDIKKSEKCYSSFFLNNCFNVFYSQNLENCSNVYFSFDCKGSNNLFLCSNLRNKSYCIKNKQYSKEEYNIELKKILNGKHSNILELENELKNIKLKSIFNENNNIDTQNSIGDYLNQADNCYKCFNLFKSQNCKYLTYGDGDQNNCQDMDYVAEAEQSYEGTMVAGYKNLFSFMIVYGSNNLYCDLCFDCNNCFGCVGLRNRQYCILNKQYTKDEYEKQVSKIIEFMISNEGGKEWGKFFPSSFSPFGYNETVAIESYILDKQEAKNRGFNWSDYEVPFPKVEKIIPANKLPDNIVDIPDDILNWAIECEITKKPFRIIAQELEFYRKNNLPLPRKHPDQRYLERLLLRNPKKLFDRKCDKCGIDIKTTYSPNREEKIYCQKCYDKEIY